MKAPSEELTEINIDLIKSFEAELSNFEIVGILEYIRTLYLNKMTDEEIDEEVK